MSKQKQCPECKATICPSCNDHVCPYCGAILSEENEKLVEGKKKQYPDCNDHVTTIYKPTLPEGNCGTC